MKLIKILGLLVIITLAGCTSTKVEPVAQNLNKNICVIANNKVIVPGFLDVVRTEFSNYGYNTRVFTGNLPASCSIILSYTATRSWDITPYMTDSELWLRDSSGNQLGYAKYHLVGGGGFALKKWASVETKMKPVIKKLLASQ